jgi:hypothetical protein
MRVANVPQGMRGAVTCSVTSPMCSVIADIEGRAFEGADGQVVAEGAGASSLPISCSHQA